ncbi:MAG: hypothetical protein IPP71_10095 [Bacteroidetes bacterium]|nr:hypothetical protein [Bacteroidota bacterium]
MNTKIKEIAIVCLLFLLFVNTNFWKSQVSFDIVQFTSEYYKIVVNVFVVGLAVFYVNYKFELIKIIDKTQTKKKQLLIYFPELVKNIEMANGNKTITYLHKINGTIDVLDNNLEEEWSKCSDMISSLPPDGLESFNRTVDFKKIKTIIDRIINTIGNEKD